MKSYDRRHISESLLTLAGQIHPSFCVGRKADHLNDKTSEAFAQAFFANATSEGLKVLWDFAEKEAANGELLVNFSIKTNEASVPRRLSKKEMESFHFPNYSWEVHPLCKTEDELREIEQAICVVVFTAK